MSDAKRDERDPADPVASPIQRGEVGSYIRAHDAEGVELPSSPLTPGVGVDAFMEDWALRHFSVSVKLHDVHRLSEGDAERLLVLEELSVVQGVLLELHDFVGAEPRLRDLMEATDEVQNGVAALYGWLDDLLDAAALRGVARGRPGFVDVGDDTLAAILRTLERVHPDLEVLLRPGALGVDPDVGQKIALCFRQIGASVVRVSGRVGSTIPPPAR